MDNKETLSEFEKMASEIGNDNKKDNLNEMIDLDEISIVEDNPVILPKTNEEVQVESSPMQQVANESAPKVESPITTDNFKFQENMSTQDINLPKTNEEVKIENVKSDVAQTIGTVKQDKQKSPIAMITLFGILALFVVFMPTILNFVNQTFGTNLETHSGANLPYEQNEDEEDNNQKNVLYDLKEDTVISIDKIDFSKFVKGEDGGYNLVFYVKNNGTTMYSFDKKVFLEFYDNDNTFIGRSYLENVKDISGGVDNKYVVDLSADVYNKAAKVEVVLRTTDDYPAVEIKDNQITCSNSNDTIVYSFDNNRLTTIRDMYTYTKGVDLEEYNNDLLSYKSRMDSLNKYDGITAVITESDSGFITSILIDYQNADYANISSNKNYYVKDTYARVISFEMSAKNYTCR